MSEVEELEKTRTQQDEPISSRGSSFNAGSRFASAQSMQRFCLLLAVGSLVVAILSIIYAFNARGQKPLVFAVDGTRTIHIGPTEDLRGDGPLFSSVAIEATIAAFTRSERGLTYRDMFDRLFLPDAQEIVLEHLREHMKEIEPRNLRLFPEVSTIEVLHEGEVRKINVSGQLNIAGSFRGLAVAETKPFEVVYAIVPNADLAVNGKYPFVIANLKIKEPSFEIAQK